MANYKYQTIDYNKLKTESIQIASNSKYNAIKIENYPLEGVPFASVSNNEGNLNILISGTTDKYLILDEYFTKNGKHPIKYVDGLTYLGESISLLDYVNANINTFIVCNGKDNKFTGGVFNDSIAGNELNEKMYGNGGNDSISGNDGNDYIDGGADDDTIDGGVGDDTIKGGVGTNTITLYKNQVFGKDIVTLTKNENLVLKLIDNDSTNCVNWYFNNLDLVFDVYNKDVSESTEGAVKQGSVTIKNYLKNDIITNSGSLMLKCLDENNFEDIREKISKEITMDSEHYTKSSYTGSWISDKVDAGNYKVYKNGVQVTTATEGYEKVRGVTVNLQNSTGETGNTVNGSIYADVLKGGNWVDRFNGTKGNDTITGGKGKNFVSYSKGDGLDTYNITKGEDFELTFSDVAKENINYTYANGTRDLKIYYTEDSVEKGSVTLKNFTSKNITNSAKVYDKDSNYTDLKAVKIETCAMKNFTGTWMNDLINGESYKIYKDKAKTIISTEYTKKGLTLNGGAGDDIITGSNYSDNLNGGLDDDTLLGSKGNDKLTGGKGADIFVFRKDDGVDTITDAAKEDAIVICDDDLYNNNGNDLRYVRNGNNLEIFYGSDYDKNNKVIVQNYYKTKEENRITSFFVMAMPSEEEKPEKFIDLSEVSCGKTVSGKYNGSNEAEVVLGGSKADVINEFAGNDIIYGYAGNDKLYGGEGNDYIDGGEGNDSIYGGSGNDTICGGVGKNAFYYSLGDGNDTILFGEGEDTLIFDEGTEVSTAYNENDLKITYSGIKNGEEVSNTITVKDFKDETKRSLKYIQVGNAKNIYVSLGESIKNLPLTAKNSINLCVVNPFDNKNYTYTIKSLQGARNFNLYYLENGRLVIEGSYLEVTASDGQKDNITIWGNYNKINTGDEADIVRLAGAMDSDFNKDYFKQSNYNTVNTGMGDDYVLFCGEKNVIDTGDGKDYALSIDSIDKSPNVQAEIKRDYLVNETNASIDGKISSFNQGQYGGDCRLLSILCSMKDNAFSDSVTITSNQDNYTVTFNCYNSSGKQNSVTFSKNELTDFKNVYGDLDVVLTDYALNKLLEINGDSISVPNYSHIETASYNMLAKYLYGFDKITVALSDPAEQEQVNVSYDYRTRVNQMWNLYKTNNIGNITVGIYDGENDYGLGIITDHAYTIKDLTENYITLVNVWDGKDILNLTLDKFFSLKTNVYSYGGDYYEEDITINNYNSGASSYVFEAGSQAGELNSCIASWISASNNAQDDFTIINDKNDCLNEFIIYYSDKV